MMWNDVYDSQEEYFHLNFKFKLRYFANGKLAQFKSRLLGLNKINRFVQITELCNWS